MQLLFELWEECNSRCKFCYLGNNNLKTSDDVKIKNLESTISKISDVNFLKENNIDCLAYIGGEFFQGQLFNPVVKSKFISLMLKTNQLMRDNIIREVWISATLTIGDQKDLYDTLDVFDNKEHIWILTSYDTIGRFHNDVMKKNWINNLANLRNHFEKININITTILTGDFIQKYIDDNVELYDIANKYRCAIFLKPTCATNRNEEVDFHKRITNEQIPNFFPNRNKFLQFLMKYKQKETDDLYDKLFNMNYRSDYLYKYSEGFKISHRIKDKSQEDVDNDICIMPCGHSTQYAIYVDDDEHCAICDKQMIKDMI